MKSLLKQNRYNSLNTWKSDQIYHAGDQVYYNGVAYTAKWWTKGTLQIQVMFGKQQVEISKSGMLKKPIMAEIKLRITEKHTKRNGGYEARSLTVHQFGHY